MKLKVFLLISMVLIISACEAQQGGTSKNDAALFEFIPNMPPTDKLYEEQNFRVGLNLINFEEKEKQVLICAYDSLRNFAGGIPEKVCDSLRLKPAYKLQDEIVGTEERVYFPNEKDFYYYQNVEGDLGAIIYAELSYQHQTIANSQMCIKRDINVEPQGIKCDLSSSENIINNDAPVKVSNLQKDIIPLGDNEVNIRLEFDIANVGSGRIVDKQDLYSDLKKDAVVDIEVVLLRERTPVIFECMGLSNGRLLFNDKENRKTLICESNIYVRDEFNTEQVMITLDYGYSIEKFTNSIKILDKDVVGQ